MYIENRLIPFSIYVGGGGRFTPPPMHHGSVKSPMHERVNIKNVPFVRLKALLKTLSFLFMCGVIFFNSIYLGHLFTSTLSFDVKSCFTKRSDFLFTRATLSYHLI